MRKLHKYKIYTKIDLVSKFPLRILKFKRPKWLRIKELFLNKANLGKELFDITSIKTNFKFWDKIRTSYKQKLRTYSFLSASLNNSIHLRKLKSESDIKIRKEMYSKMYFENFYKPCTLTWLSHFFSSNVEAKQKIHSKNLLINDNLVGANYLLEKGDIISIKDSTIVTKIVSQKYNKTLSILTHVEIDYYSQTIVILKDLSTLSEEDYYLLCLDYINIQILR